MRARGMTDSPLLRAQNLVKDFASPGAALGARRAVRAVDDVSFDVHVGETLGVVGESGSGKTTLGRLAIGLLPPTRGEVVFEGTNLAVLSASELRRKRRRMQIVFQDPLAALNPRLTVGEALTEPLLVHGIVGSKREARARAAELLRRVGLSDEHLERHPHELSGGQRQRVVIARAIAVEPRLLVCDEPVAALDVSVQAQVVNLLLELQETLGLAYLFVAHDIALVRLVSHRVAVMYLGQVVEIGPTEEVCSDPAHPYTKALLDAVPSGDPARRRSALRLAGEPPSPSDPSVRVGCVFRSRCPQAERRCGLERPSLRPSGSSRERHVACHLAP